MAGLLSRALQRVRTPAQPTVADLGEDDSPPAPPCEPICDCHVRELVTIRGTITGLVVNPQGQRRWLEGDIDDGTGSVTLAWMGRDRIAGVHEGSRLQVTGRIVNRRGRQVIYNPQYELLGD